MCTSAQVAFALKAFIRTYIQELLREGKALNAADIIRQAAHEFPDYTKEGVAALVAAAIQELDGNSPKE